MPEPDAEREADGSTDGAMSPVKSLVFTIAIPSVYLGALLVAWLGPKHFGFGVRPLVYAGLTVGLSGLLFWIVAMVQLGKSLAVLPGGDRLVSRGVYRCVRHPVYWGIVLTFFGLFLAVGSVQGMVYLFVVVVPLNIVRARQEERAMQKKFGEAYTRYRRQTWF
ncbi:protein-S-isoprenylcysteine O-methyltransferase Ste14 [Nitrospina gracilis]|uniref:methyltransferase family protein n=1 Tax=Nitrospina TaxID=35800 RepID=UPI0011831B0D|nr:isoprenylcysteine carboxylmethyltransferase family protein [Nitrospina gracilis]MCF8723242.1 protein-S-isoprenylcysteine O-methyltransferase Ste14 [Nitrospina sp. Nb-3]